MKKLNFIAAGLAVAAVAALVMWVGRPVSAHEGREVGDGKYEITFGWQVEPAYVGVYNGPEVFIKTHGVTEEDEKPVIGAEKTLKLKVMFGNQSKELTLKPAWQDPGHYVAQLTPTRPGDYSFQLTGTLNGNGEASATESVSDTEAVSSTETVSTSATISPSETLSSTETISPTVINEMFTSANGQFGTVEPSSDVLFPDTKADVVSLQSEINTLKTQLKTLQDAVTALQTAKK
ncbi:MAG: hypothetical protein NT075_09750 [Chloroflexi bacterium]|nr:hypothetical protein [Chloroflexota bacterium]